MKNNPPFFSLLRIRIAVLLSLAGSTVLLPHARAQTTTWTGATGGDWNTGSNWSGSAKPVTAGTALFNTTLGSVANAVANQTVRSISFDTNAGTANGTFTIGTTGGNNLTLSSGGTTQILSTLTGTGKAISINAPIVLAPASVTTAGTYTFSNNNANATNTLNFGGPISGGTTSNTVTLTLAGANNGTNTISGAITKGSATTFGVTKGQTGAGTWILSGANTYNGGTAINNGILQLNAGAGGSLNSASTLTFGSYNGAFILDNTGATGAISQNLTMGGISGGDAVIQINRVAAQNLTLTLSTLTFPSNQATLNYVTSGTPGVNGTDSKIVITGRSAGTLANNIYFNGSNFAYYDAAGYVRGINYGVDGSSATSAGTASIASPTQWQRVTGAVTAQNTATFTNLLISGANDFTLAASQTVTVTSLIKSGGGASIISGGSGITLGGSNNYFRLDSASDSLTISNAIAGTGRFVKSGSGTLILSGSNNYAGEFALNNGVVNIQNANALGTTAGVTNLKGGALQIQGGITVTGETLNLAGMGINNDGALRNISGNNTWAGNITTNTDLAARINSDSGTLTISGGIVLSASAYDNVFGGAGNISVSGIISSTGRLLKDGSGTLTLSGNNTSNGGFTIQEGVVSIATINNKNASGPLGSRSSMTMGGTSTVGTLSYTGANASSTMDFALNAGGANYEVTNAATALTLSGQISGTTGGGLTKSGSGTLILSGYNAYSGSTTINGGTLQIAAVTNRIGSSPQLTLNGGTLYTVGEGSLLTLGSGSGVVLGSGGGTFRTDSATPLTIAGVVSGSGSLTKTDSGTLTLNGSNTYTGATTIGAGTLEIASTGRLGGGSYAQNIANSGTFIYSGTNSQTLSGNISGSGLLTKNASSALVLSGTNTYTGATTVNAGTLQLAKTASLYNGTTASWTASNMTVNSGATLALNVGGSGEFSAGNVSTLLTGLGGLGGAVNNNGLRSGSIIAFDTTNAGSSFTISDNIANSTGTGGGAINFTKLGSGALVLSGNNSYTGVTIVNAGTLQLAKTASLYNGNTASWTASNMTVNSGATLALNVGGSGEFSAGNVTTLLTGLGGLGGAVNNNGLRSGSIIAFDTTNASGSSFTIADNIANSTGTGGGAIGLTKLGSGALILSGNNTYTGGTTLSAGILGINATNALGTTGNITFSGGTMQFASGGSAADYGARIKNSTSAMILDTNGQSATFAGAMDSSNTGGLTKNGTGTLSLSAANAYTGGTTINGGTLALSGAAGSVAGAIAVNTGAALQLNRSADATISNNISGAGNIVQSSAFTTTLDGTNTNSGAVEATAGTLLFSGAGALSASTASLNASNSATLSFADGTTGNSTIAGNINLSGSSLIKFDINGASSDFLSTASGIASLDGSGKIQLNLISAPTTTTTWNLIYAGGGLTSNFTLDTASFSPGSFDWSLGTDVDNKYLQLTAAASNSNSYWLGATSGNWSTAENWAGSANGTGNGTVPTSAFNVTFAATGATNPTTTLDSDRTIKSLTVDASGFTIDGSNTLTINGTTIAISAAGNTAINANLAGASAVLTKSGAGTLTLNGSNTYAGGTQITGGTVVVGSSTALGNSSGPAVTLNPGSGNTATLRSGASDLTLANNIVLSSGTAVFDTNSNNTTLSGVLSSVGALSKTGAGILTLTANNTHTGGITISAGGIALSGSGALADSEPMNLAASGTSFDISAISASGETIASIAGASGSSIALGSKTLTVGGDNTSTTFSGSMGGTGGALVKTGSGTLTLAGGNTYTGTTTITAGGLQIGNGGTTGSLSTSSTITNNGVLTFNRSNNLAQGTDFSATAIGGSGSLVQSGTGNLTLSSANTYSGGTTLNSGTLVLNNSTAIGTGALTINGGSLNNTSGASITLTSNNNQTWNANIAFAGTNDLNLGTGTVALGSFASRTVTVTSGNLTVGGVISGTSSSLTKAGSGTLTLTGNNTYNGGTTISAGTLELAGSTANLAGSISNTGTLLISRTGNLTIAGLISNNGTLLFTGSGNTTINGGLNGSGTFTQNSSGLVTMGTGAGSYTGNIIINNGSLKSTQIGSWATNGNYTVNGGTLDVNTPGTISRLMLLNGNVLTSNLTATNGFILQNGSVSTNLVGSGALTKNGSGTVTLSANNTISGTTTVADGTLILSGNGTLGTSTITITGGTLDMGGKSLTNTVTSLTGGTLVNGTITNNGGNYAFQNGTVSAILAGTNGLTKTGSGTTTLTASNTYSGATTISAGNLSINALAALGSTSAINIGNTGALIYTGGAATLDRAISVTSGTGTVRNNGGALTLTGGLTKNGTTLTFDSGTFTVNTVGISGSAANSDLVIDGATVNLNIANTYNGPTSIINGATLNANVTNALPTANGRTAISIDTTGTGSSTLALGASQSIASLTGAASSNLTLGANTLTLGTTSGNTTYAGRITGASNSALVKDGASTQVLTGNNSGFTGTTTINSGTLQAAAAGAMGNSTVINVTGGSFLVTADNAVNASTNINLDGGRMAVSGNFNENVGLLTLSKNSTIDFAGFSGVLRFSGVDSWAPSANLAIWNWSGTTRWGTQVNNYQTPSNLVFTTVNSTLTSNLANISFYSDNGNSFVGSGFEVSGFLGGGSEIIAVPETETYLYAVALLAGVVIQYLRRRAKRKTWEGQPPA